MLTYLFSDVKQPYMSDKWRKREESYETILSSPHQNEESQIAAPKYLASDRITGTIAPEKMSSSTDVGL